MKYSLKLSIFVFFSASEGPSARINISQLGYRKVTSALWGTLDEYVITGHESGDLVQWDVKVVFLSLILIIN